MSKPSPCWNIALLAGGDSDEREISLQSGESVRKALAERGHSVIHLDPAIVDLNGVDWRPFDVAFLALHGQYGEDGQVQLILESAEIPYTGSDSKASRLAFSKSAAKERFLQFGVPTPEYSVVHLSDDTARLEQITHEIGYPLVVKPDCQGSSIGVSIVRTPDEFPAAMKLCYQFDSFAVIERAIPGLEWTVGLLDDLVLPPILIETDREFFDFQAKYQDDSTRYHLNFDTPQHQVNLIKSIAVEAAKALGTRGLSRVDLRLDHAGQPWVLEVNTIPGFTSHSLVPKAAAHMGIEFGELCERAIESCLSQRLLHPHILPKPRVRQQVEQS